MDKINNLDFFRVDTITLAQKLIGKWIETEVDGVKTIAQICESEAYLGVKDSACHTFNGKRTAGNEPMWQDGGTIYIYLCYGLHYLFNIVSKGVGEPEAVLVRGVVGSVGPAKATKFLHIDKSFNGQSMVANPRILLWDDGKKYEFLSERRVGIDYAKEEDKNAKLRFVLKQN